MNKLLESIHPGLVELAKKIDLGDHYEGCSEAPMPSRMNYPTLYVSGKKDPIELPDKGKATVEYRIRNRSVNKYGEDAAKHSVDIEIHSIEPHETEGKKEKQSALFEDVRKLRLLARGDVFKKLLPGYREHRSFRGGLVQKHQAEALRQIRRILQTRAKTKGLPSAAPWVDSFDAVPKSEVLLSDTRARNSMGEYTSDPGEGVDPNQMAAAYGPPEVSESHMERVKNFFLKRRQAAGTPAQAG